VIVFKDGTKAEYNTSDIKRIYYSELKDSPEIQGKWYGDKGIQTVYITEKDLFSIQLENGYSWSGVIKREDDLYIFETPFPIPVEYFENYNIPKDIASKVREVIKKPDRWQFRLSDDGQFLSGQKNCVQISFSQSNLFDIDFVERKAEWQRK